ncbi:MAG: hypothetical protein KF729_05555 [Sandaracinaceae bacterium]|nr:hypothetical protein [Sandaracinaceae bacterium]
MTNDSVTRPPGLWAVAILALVLGSLGSCGGVLGLVNVALQESMVQMQETLQQHEPNPAMREMNAQIQRRSLEIASAWRVPMIAGQGVNVLGSLLLLVAGILLFRWHPQAPTIFFVAVALSIVADLLVGGVGLIVQRQTVAALTEVTANLSGSGDPAAERMMGSVLRASGTFGFCFAIGWLVAKLGTYVGSVVYLRKEPVRALFG